MLDCGAEEPAEIVLSLARCGQVCGMASQLNAGTFFEGGGKTRRVSGLTGYTELL
jgi:hypothetical protein